MRQVYHSPRATIYQGSIMEFQPGDLDYDYIWTDPPWNPGVLRLFERQASARRAPSLGILLDRLALFAANAPLGAHILYSASTPQYLETAMPNTPWVDAYQSDNGKPCRLYCTAPPPDNGLTGQDLIAACYQTLPPGTRILDPFLGTGLAIPHAIRRELHITGIEISAKRCQQAIDRIP